MNRKTCCCDMLMAWPIREDDALAKERRLRATPSKAPRDVYSVNDESRAACHLRHYQICSDYESLFSIAVQRIPDYIHEAASRAQPIPRGLESLSHVLCIATDHRAAL